MQISKAITRNITFISLLQLTESLTSTCSSVLNELTVAQLVRKFPALYGSQGLVIVFTRVRRWYADPDKSNPNCLTHIVPSRNTTAFQVVSSVLTAANIRFRLNLSFIRYHRAYGRTASLFNTFQEEMADTRGLVHLGEAFRSSGCCDRRFKFSWRYECCYVFSSMTVIYLSP